MTQVIAFFYKLDVCIVFLYQLSGNKVGRYFGLLGLITRPTASARVQSMFCLHT